MNDEIMRGLLDAHTHILPGMDDGCHHTKDSIELIRRAVAGGVTSLCLTPHFYPKRESPERFLKRREASVRALVGAARELPGMPHMYFGAEVEYFEGISQAEGLDRLTIGHSPVLLVEMPFCTWTDRMASELCALKTDGILPMVAHVERYVDAQKTGVIQDLCDHGILFQANASFFLRFGTFRRAMRMLSDGQIHMLGSDSHNATSRPPNLADACRKICAKGGGKELARLRNYEHLICGRQI